MEIKVKKVVMAIRVPRARKVTLVHRVQLGLLDLKEQKEIPERRDLLVPLGLRATLGHKGLLVLQAQLDQLAHRVLKVKRV